MCSLWISKNYPKTHVSPMSRSYVLNEVMWVSVVKGLQSCGLSDFEDDPIIWALKQGWQNFFQIPNFEVLQTLKNLTGRALPLTLSQKFVGYYIINPPKVAGHVPPGPTYSNTPASKFNDGMTTIFVKLSMKFWGLMMSKRQSFEIKPQKKLKFLS